LPDPWNDFLRHLTHAKPDETPSEDPAFEAVLNIVRGLHGLSQTMPEGGRMKATRGRLERLMPMDARHQAWEIVDLGECPDGHEHFSYAIYFHPEPGDPAPADVIRMTVMNGCSGEVASTRMTPAALGTLAQQYLELAAIAEAGERTRGH
jgi:hypothetical protein